MKEDAMVCEGCDTDSTRLRYCGANGFLCATCEKTYGIARKDYKSMAYFHQKTGNKWAPKQTYIDKMNIVTRKIGPDGIARPAKRFDSNHY